MQVTIPKIKFADAKYRLDALIARAKKLNINASYHVVEEGETFFPYIDYDNNYSNALMASVTLELSTEKIVLSGYEFVAKIEHVTEENIIVLSYESLDRTKYTQPNCNHCNTNRRRNTTFVVRNTDTQEVMQVGSTCVNDFLGEGTLASAMSSFQFVKEAQGTLLDMEESYRSTRYYKVEDVLACALYVSNNGTRYVKRYEDVFSTADEVAGCMSQWALGKIVEDTEPHLAKAKEVIESIQNDPSDSDYIQNLKSILVGGYVELNTASFRILVSACVLARPKEGGDLKQTHFGTEKERYRKVDVTFTKGVYLGEGEFGPKMLYLLNFDGYELTWFTGNTDIEVGSTANVSFTIKEHTYYKSIPQTRITRLTVH